MLKNVGLICDGCGGGHHENCELEIQKREGTKNKRMCVCFYSTHPYLSKEQLTPKIISEVIHTYDNGAELHKIVDKASGVSAAIRPQA